MMKLTGFRCVCVCEERDSERVWWGEDKQLLVSQVLGIWLSIPFSRIFTFESDFMSTFIKDTVVQPSHEDNFMVIHLGGYVGEQF